MRQAVLYELTLGHHKQEFDKLLRDMRLPQLDKIKGKNVGVLVGSRGICNLNRIIFKVIEEIKFHGGIPYIIPAMGSHGGGTPEGQISLLRRYGISPELTGAKIITKKNYIELGKVFGKEIVVANAAVSDMDTLVAINKIKPHQSFSGNYESGLLKLISVGLGSTEGAKKFHRTVAKYGFEETLIETSKIILSSLDFLCLIGIVEDCIGSTLQIEVIDPDDIYCREKALLEIARKNMPFLPFYDIDLLITDEMGKNYSGGGIDACVVGGRKEKEKIAKRIYVRRLSSESEGNAMGIGLSDFISRSLFESIDFKKTYKNALSSMQIENAKIPLWFDSDEECIEYALTSIGKEKDDEFELALINNTTDLSRIYVTPNILRKITGNYSIIGRSTLLFDKKGMLLIKK